MVAGTSNYPGALDDFAESSPTNLGDADTTGRTHSERHDDVEAAMEAVQEELGTDPSGASASTVAARFTAIETDYLTASAASAAYLTQSDASATYLAQTDATSTYLSQANASATYLTQVAASSTYLTLATASTNYLTASAASATYLTQASANSTYLTQATASSTYLTQANASATYLTQTEAATDYIAASVVTTAGDLIIGAGSASVTRLGKGAQGYVLTSSSAGAQGIVWAAPTGGGGATVEMSPTEPADPDDGTLWVDTDSNVPTFTASAYVLNALLTNKAALITATAASTPATLTVGANDTVLTADSSTSTGLAWKAPASGGLNPFLLMGA